MKKRSNLKKRWIAVLLTASLTVTLLSNIAMAEDLNDSPDVTICTQTEDLGEEFIISMTSEESSLENTLVVTESIELASNTSNVSGGISWSFNEETGVLTISPSDNPESGFEKGVMRDWNDTTSENVLALSERPWANLNVTSLIIEEGVTVIGRASFQDMTSISGNIVIPDSVTEINGVAFSGCTGLSGTLTLGENIESDMLPIW